MAPPQSLQPAKHKSFVERQNARWPCYDCQRSLNQQPDATQYRSVVDGMIISCANRFSRHPTISDVHAAVNVDS